ncbi:protein of unknown function [Nitrospira japonica]|uniref:Uncharacterized protein n=1 Tax=Nitrospira japonica TaxID=1325564 RepID=A0A1W1IAF7_9BACT|nr:hypothetical protein [Nitrospira japonica]SLM50037.1 protein of unknown function [Nitrospira japonica]
MDPETFRRICMVFDGLVVGFGLSRVVRELDLASSLTTYGILTIVILINAYLLFRFFRDWDREFPPVSTSSTSLQS